MIHNTKIALRTLLFALLATGLFFVGCKKDDDDTAEENITKVELHITAGGFDQKFAWEDADGDGGNAPTIDSIILPANVVYSARIHLFDGNKEITSEIEKESTEHVFTFFAPGADLTVNNLSTDTDGQPFGLESRWIVGNASMGNMNIKLFHEPTDKSNAFSPGGEVDFDITFPLRIQ
jgi:hypothetical protein